MKTRTKAIVILCKLNDCNGKVEAENRWYVYFSYRNPQTGKMERFRDYEEFAEHKTREAKRAHAKKLILKYNRKLKNGWNPFEQSGVIYEDSLAYHKTAQTYGRKKASNKNFRYHMSKYLDLKKAMLSKSTYETYQSKFRIFTEWLETKGMEDIEFSLFTYTDVKEFVIYMREKKGSSNKTINTYRSLLASLCKELVKEKLMRENPFMLLDILKTEDNIPQFYSKEQLTELKEATLVKDPQLWLFEEMIYYCYIRPNELRFLKMECIDFTGGTIFIPKEISKNKKDGTVIIPDPLLQKLLASKYNTYPKEHYLFSVKGIPDKTCVGRNYFGNHFRKVRKEIKLDTKYKLYNFKHTGNIMAHKNGVPVKDIQLQDRHHSLDVTDRYLRAMTVRDSEHLRTGFKAI